MKKYILILFYLVTIKCVSQTARFDGLANTSATLYDIWSTTSNQAGLSAIKHPTIAVNYANSFFTKETATQLLAGVIPTKTGNFGLVAKHFGYSLYSENNIGVSFSRSLGKYIDAGIQFDYLFYVQPENYGNKGAVLFEMGIIAKPIQNLFIGVHVYNPTQTKIAKNNEYIPSIMRFGLGYKFISKVTLNIETEKRLDYKPRFKTGVEYEPVNKLNIRTGFCTNPTQFSFGLGYSIKKLTADMAILSHQNLPLSSSISIKYTF